MPSALRRRPRPPRLRRGFFDDSSLSSTGSADGVSGETSFSAGTAMAVFLATLPFALIGALTFLGATGTSAATWNSGALGLATFLATFFAAFSAGSAFSADSALSALSVAFIFGVLATGAATGTAGPAGRDAARRVFLTGFVSLFVGVSSTMVVAPLGMRYHPHSGPCAARSPIWLWVIDPLPR